MIQLSGNTIKTIKRLFNVGFISFIIFQLIEKALSTLPDNWLFFITSDAVENFVFASIVYTIYYYVLKIKNIWQKIAYIFIFIITLIALALLKDFRIHRLNSFNQTFEYFTSFLGLTLMFYLLLHFINKLEIFNRYKKLETELHQAKEQLLRQQFNPHFLFNAFNSLYSMSLKNHPKTSDTILKLSGMMRYLTDDTNIPHVKLSQELNFIQEYISIEKIRFGEKSNIQFTINGDPIGKEIEPLLFITLVENAFKHGFYTNDQSAFVHITLHITDTIAEFSIENSIQPKQHFQKEERTGKGLDILKKRLKLSYPKKSKLTLIKKDAVYLAKLKIYFS